MGIQGRNSHLGTFYQEAMEDAILLSVQWDLTWRCDHNCVHCYLTDRRQPELTLEECVRVLDELADMDTLLLTKCKRCESRLETAAMSSLLL